MDYKKVYDELMFLSKNYNKTITDSKAKSHPRNGVPRKVYDAYIKSLGFAWVPTMKVGGGCTHHLKKDELPNDGNLIVSVSKHMTTVINGVIHDTHDPSRGQTRCVYGYYIKDWAMWRDERIDLVLAED
jgi:hypothetical protein